MPAVCDGVGEGVGEDSGFIVDLAAGVEEGEGVKNLDRGEKTHCWCYWGEDEEVYLVEQVSYCWTSTL